MDDERFWIMPIVEGDGHAQSLAEGEWWGVVDELSGGVIAYAVTEDTAAIIRDAFRNRAPRPEL